MYVHNYKSAAGNYKHLETCGSTLLKYNIPILLRYVSTKRSNFLCRLSWVSRGSKRRVTIGSRDKRSIGVEGIPIGKEDIEQGVGEDVTHSSRTRGRRRRSGTSSTLALATSATIRAASPTVAKLTTTKSVGTHSSRCLTPTFGLTHRNLDHTCHSTNQNYEKVQCCCSSKALHLWQLFF